MDIRKKLKSEFKNYISDGLKIYFSYNRPINEIMIYIQNKIYSKGAFIWDLDNKFLITYEPIPDNDLKEFELKEFDFNFMSINNNRIILDFYTIFDIEGLNLKDILNNTNGISICDIKPYFNNWFSVNDIFIKYEECLKDLY